MAVHRFRELLNTTASASGAGSGGFVPCPVAVVQALSADQRQFVVEVYRLAQERAREQLRCEASYLPTYSAN